MPLLSHFCFDNRAIIAELQNTQEIERQSYTLASKIENIKKQLKETPDNEKLKKTLESMESTLQTIHENPQAYQLKKVQKSLQEIYFKQGQSRADIQKELLSPRFNDFPQLKDLLHQIFSNEEVITLNLTLQDKQAIQSFAELNAKYGYFNEDVDELYQSLAASCYKMTALIEGQASDDEMAYKLMALFYSKDCQTPEKISAAFNQFTGQITHPYHFVFITELNQFPPQKLKWQEFIHKNGMAALKIFAQHQAFETVPESLEIAQAILFKKKYPRAEENKALAQLCKKLLISNQGFEAGLEFIQTGFPKKTSDHLPIVDIADETGQYFWVKLPPQDLRALYLGNLIPDCCQFINGHSAQCVKDGMSLSDNGFYVLLKAKKQNTSAVRIINSEINDKDFDIVAQSYAWLSMNGNLCLDSIEWHRERVSLPVIQELMEKFSQDIFSHSDIKHLNVGRGGQTPQRIYRPSPINEGMRQGHQYRDSAQQFKIKSNMRPEQEKALQERLKSYPKDFQEMILYIAPYFADIEQIPQALVAINPNIVQMLNKYLSKIKLPPQLKPEDFRAITFEQFQEMTPEEQSKVSSICKLFNTEFNTNQQRELLQWLPTMPSEDCIYISFKNFLYDTPTCIKVLEHLPPNMRQIIFQDRGENDNTVLSYALKYYPALLERLLLLLPEETRLEAMLKKKYSYQETILHRVTLDSKLLEILLKTLSINDRITAILESEKDLYGNTILHKAAANIKLYEELPSNKPESLLILLNQLPEDKRLEAILKQNSSDNTVLHEAAENPKSLFILLNQLPEEKRLEIILKQNLFGNTVLHEAAKNPESLLILLNLLPKEKRLEAILKKNKHGDTILHLAAKNPESLSSVLESINIEERFKVIQSQNNFGNSVFHEATPNPKSLQTLLEFLPQEQSLLAIKSKNKDGDTILHLTATNPESLKIILKRFPKDKLLSALQEKDNQGRTVFDIANFKSLSVLLDSLSTEEHFNYIQEKNSDGNTILHESLKKPNLFSIILSKLPPLYLLKAIQITNDKNETLLNYSVQYPQSFKMILQLLPGKNFLNIIKTKDSIGCSLIHYAVSHPESLQIMLNLLTHQERLVAIKEKNSKGDSALKLASKNPKSLRVILNTLPLPLNLVIQARESELETKSDDVIASAESIELFIKKLEALNIPKDNINSVVQALINNTNIEEELKKLCPQTKTSFFSFFSSSTDTQVKKLLHDLHPFWKAHLPQEPSSQAFRKT